MPYKDPEHKRQWEREHRAQRNAQRKNRMSPASHSLADLKRMRELGSTQAKETKGGWKSLIALAIGFGAIVLGVVSGITTPLPPDTQGPNLPE